MFWQIPHGKESNLHTSRFSRERAGGGGAVGGVRYVFAFGFTPVDTLAASGNLPDTEDLRFLPCFSDGREGSQMHLGWGYTRGYTTGYISLYQWL